MRWRSSEIEVYHTIDLADYDDDIMEYMEPDNITDAMEMMDRWGYSDGDILEHMMDDPSAFLEKVSSILTVETALGLVKDVYEYGHGIMAHNLTVKTNQIDELKQRVDDLLALNHTVITEKEETDGDS